MANRRLGVPLEIALGLSLLLGATALLAGCTSSSYQSARTTAWRPPAGQARRTHTVAPGETVYHVAHEYDVSVAQLMAANGLSDPRELAVGQVLVIPGHPLAAASVMGIPQGWFAPPADRQFAWPLLAGQLSSPFGIRNGVMHEGIDIAAPAGTPVRAADDGSVIYAGRLHGYGNVVILQHTGDFVTVYGHNQRNLVSVGERVRRGQEIAELGATGRASGPNLHFEVRYDNRPQNPISYLPPPRPDQGITFARNAGYQ